MRALLGFVACFVLLATSAQACTLGFHCDCAQCAADNYAAYCPANSECYSLFTECEVACGGGCIPTGTCPTGPTPTRPVWPNTFTSTFGLQSDVIHFGFQNASSRVTYDWNLQAQRLDFYEHCSPETLIRGPCTMIFLNRGIFIFDNAREKKCCRFFKDLGAPRPDFLKNFTFAGLTTATDQSGQVHDVNHWTSIEAFGYWTDVNTGANIKFKDGPLLAYWHFGPMEPSNAPPSTFDVPQDCTASCILDSDMKPQQPAFPHRKLEATRLGKHKLRKL